MSESSDNSDSEQIKMILEATDTNFLSDSMFKNSLKDENPKYSIEKKDESDLLLKETEKQLKSERYLDIEESFDNDLKIPPGMQEHLAKRLSNIISNLIEFVNVEPIESKKRKKTKDRVKLLKGYDEVVKSTIDIEHFIQKKPIIRRRIVESDDIDEDEKCSLAAIEPEIILTKNDIQYWSNRSKATKFFQYRRTKDGTLQYIEPENEFTKMRKKNCWTEKRIIGNSKSR